MNAGRQTAVRQRLGLNRNVAVLALSIFGLGLGEELWQSYLPKYLTALGASGAMVGLFSSLKDLLDGLYQYPGGWAGHGFQRVVRISALAARDRRAARRAAYLFIRRRHGRAHRGGNHTASRNHR